MAWIRADSPETVPYKIPYGGAFEYVSGANFFGEIVEWYGWGIAGVAVDAVRDIHAHHASRAHDLNSAIRKHDDITNHTSTPATPSMLLTYD
eukprot:gene14850-biopygen37094